MLMATSGELSLRGIYKTTTLANKLTMLKARLWVIPGMPHNALERCLPLAGLPPNASIRLFIVNLPWLLQ